MGKQTKSFRNTKSERSATDSYRGYGKYRMQIAKPRGTETLNHAMRSSASK